MGLYLLIPLSVLLVFVIGVIFWWAVRSGQYDDLEGPGFRVLMDDEKPPSRDGGGGASKEARESGENHSGRDGD